MFRYLGIIETCERGTQSPTLDLIARRLRSSASGWHSALETSHLKIYVAGTEPPVSRPYPMSDGSGVLLGTAFVRDESLTTTGVASAPTFDDPTTAKIVRSGGRELIIGYWGRYVAFVTNRSTQQTWVVRDPTGDLPCYFTFYRGVAIVFSCLADCLALSLQSLEVNWSYIRERLGGGTTHTIDTALQDVFRIRPGECVEFLATAHRRTFYWTPEAVLNRGTIEDTQSAIRALRLTAKHCVHTLASCHESIVHRLSGGLDSSIVLGCLVDAPTNPNVTCLTRYFPGERSDERFWSRVAARRTMFEHVEAAETCQIDFSDMLRLMPSARPERDISFMLRRFELDLARQRRSTAIFNGDGGDSLFGAATTGRAIEDYVARHGLRLQLLRLACNLAPLLNVSVWRLLTTALRQRFGLETATPLSADTDADTSRFVNRELIARAASNDWLKHPWFESNGRSADSPAITLSSWLFVDPSYHPLGDRDDGELLTVAPLSSQPMVELCLRIPSYVNVADGRSRGLARRAFDRDVPAEILRRQWKDRPPNGVTALIFERNLKFICSILLDGTLSEQQLLNRTALEATLHKGNSEMTNAAALEIFELVSTECWLRQWNSQAAPRTQVVATA